MRKDNDPIQILRSVGNCSWCWKHSKLPDADRRLFFQRCIETCDLPEGEDRKKWLKVFEVLRDYNHKTLLKMAGGDKSQFRHCFNWTWYKQYQAQSARERRARRKAGSASNAKSS